MEQTYSWTQDLSEIIISLNVQEGTSKKDVVINVSNNLSVEVNGKLLISDSFYNEVYEDQVSWILNGTALETYLQKKDKDWWKCVIKGHKEIDLTKIEPEKSKLSDLDVETRTIVEKMLLEQRQKEFDSSFLKRS